jgi:hypothetical protein
MKHIKAIIPLALLLSGCASDPQEREQQLGGLATVSALVVALPLIPFTESYHALNQTEKKLREKREYWESVFDPVYAERIEIIDSRSPEQDAELVFSQGTEVYFPSLLNKVTRFDLGALYPGVENIWNEDPDKKMNYERSQANELTQYMWTLMSEDPSHLKAEHEDDVTYFSEVWKRFISSRFTYMERFNLTMHQLSNKTVLSTPGASPLPR